MLMGSSGFDVVVPTAAFIQRQIRSGAYLTLDKTQLPNLANPFTRPAAVNDNRRERGVAIGKPS